MRKKAKQPRIGKTLWKYESLSETKRKEWYTASQVHLGFPDYFMLKDDIQMLDDSEDIRKIEFLLQTEDYRTHLMHRPNEYYTGVMYKVEKFYNYQDIVDRLDDVFTERRLSEHDLKSTKTNDIRNFLSERSYLKGDRKELVTFYGTEVESIKSFSRGDNFRFYYSMFMFYPFIRKMFERNYRIKSVFLDAALHLYAYKFLTLLDFNGFYRRRFGSGTARKSWNSLIEEGYIEEVKYEKTSEFYQRQNKSTPLRKMFKITSKTRKIVELFMDYTMFRRKIPYVGESYSDFQITGKDMHLRNVKSMKMNPTVPYHLYEHMYQWINFQAEVKLTDDDMITQLKKSTSANFTFNPFVFRLAEHYYLNSNGEKDNKRYIKNFLKNYKFGYIPE